MDLPRFTDAESEMHSHLPSISGFCCMEWAFGRNATREIPMRVLLMRDKKAISEWTLAIERA
jgi:hypothetical protein